jgi:sugar O-acyltransferase (sialic acid O-acetyltransferase NeuD family)
MKNIYGIYGASGFGKEVLPLLRESIESKNIYFIDDNSELDSLNGYEVLTFNTFLNKKADNYFVSIAIAKSQVRELLTHRCLENGIKILDIHAKNIVVLDNVEIEKGAILSPFVTLTSNIKIGKSFHANLYSYVAHDCVIGDYVTFAPAVKCNGNIKIEDHVYIGTGAIIKQGKPSNPLIIGKGATIGAGAVVTRSIPSGMTVFGNPAIELTKENLRRRK